MKAKIDLLDSRQFFISMTPVEEIVQIGQILELNSDSSVLDLCCGYGEMLRLFAGCFDSHGTGVDVSNEFIDSGIARLGDLSDRVTLLRQDAKTWSKGNFDVACLSGAQEIFGGFEGTLKKLLTFIKASGSIIIGAPYYHSKPVPKALVEYEGDLETEAEIFAIVERNNCAVTCIGRDTRAEWDRYICWSARRGIAEYRGEADPEKKNEMLVRLRRWYTMYLDYRKELQGWAMYVIQRL